MIMLYNVCSDVGNRTERDVLGLSQRCLAFRKGAEGVLYLLTSECLPKFWDAGP